jgi:hypothetical protein
VFTFLKLPAAAVAYMSGVYVNVIQKKLLGGFKFNLAGMFYGLYFSPGYLLDDLDLLSRSLQVIYLILRHIYIYIL